MTDRVKAKRILGIVLAASTLTVMAGAIIGPVVRDVSAGLNVDPSSAGLIITTHGLFIFLLSPVAGSLIDRFGVKRPFFIGLLLYGISGGSGLVINSYVPLLVSRAFLGASVALVFTSVTVVILNAYEGAARNRAMGLRSMANSLSGAVWPLLGGALGLISWQLPFGVYLVGIPLGLLALVYMPDIEPRGEDGDGTVLSILRSRPVLFLIYGLMLLLNALQYAIVIYLPERLGGVGITTSFQVSLFLATMAVAGGITASRYHRIRARLAYPSILPLAFLSWGLGFSLIFTTHSYLTYGLAVALFGVGQGMMRPTVMLWVGDVVPTPFLGRFSSYLATFGFLGQFLSPVFFGPVAKALQVGGVFLVATGISAAGLLLALLNLARRSGRLPPPP
ncbi:MAG: MFS transporter [Candidatus Bipolaricaulota bacterium]